jgi:hypothetical protein
MPFPYFYNIKTHFDCRVINHNFVDYQDTSYKKVQKYIVLCTFFGIIIAINLLVYIICIRKH